MAVIERTYEAWECPTCGAWQGGRCEVKAWAAWCDGACSHPKVAMERVTLVRQPPGAVEAFKALRWNAVDGMDEHSDVIVERESFDALRRALGGSHE